MVSNAKKTLILCIAVLGSSSILFAAPNESTQRLYFLPQDSAIKRKLDAIRDADGHANVVSEGITQANADFMHKIQQDYTWRPLCSFHWLIGRLSTLDGNTEFVVKAADRPARKKICFGWDVMHDDRQNISRVYKSEEVNRFLKDEHIQGMRAVRTWAYPVSRELEGKPLDECTDQDVVIVEEFVQQARNSNFLLSRLNPLCLSVLQRLVREKGVEDLHPGNVTFDQNGTIVLTDLEALYQGEKTRANEAPLLLRPFYRYKAQCKIVADAKKKLAGIYCQNHCPNIQKQGISLRNEAWLDLKVKRYAFEIMGIGCIGAGLCRVLRA